MRTCLPLAMFAVLASAGASAHQAMDAELGWGDVRNGLQARLILEGGRAPVLPTGLTAGDAAKTPTRVYAPGDMLSVKVVLKNVSAARKELKLCAMQKWGVTVGADTLTLNTWPGVWSPVVLTASEERVFNWPAVRIGYLATPARKNMLPIVPGMYAVTLYSPFFESIEGEPTAFHGLLVTPGTLRIQITSGDRPVPRPVRADGRGDVFWGAPANGLQLGYRYVASDRHVFRPGDVVRGELLVRNNGSIPLNLTCWLLAPYDVAPTVTDEIGTVRYPYAPRPFPFLPPRTSTLKPGASLTIARPELHILGTREFRSFAGLAVTLRAGPGRFTMTYERYMNQQGSPDAGVFVDITTAPIPFRVVP